MLRASRRSTCSAAVSAKASTSTIRPQCLILSNDAALRRQFPAVARAVDAGGAEVGQGHHDRPDVRSERHGGDGLSCRSFLRPRHGVASAGRPDPSHRRAGPAQGATCRHCRRAECADRRCGPLLERRVPNTLLETTEIHEMDQPRERVQQQRQRFAVHGSTGLPAELFTPSRSRYWMGSCKLRTHMSAVQAFYPAH